MKITTIELQNFRNHIKKEVRLSDTTTLISGSNGSGKTNILEAISVLSKGRSFRAVTEKEMINIDSNFCRAVGVFEDNTKLEFIEERSGMGRVKKTFKKNGVVKKSKDFVGIFKTVLFNPEDIRLVIGSPSRRRDYVDGLLSQVSSEYYRTIHRYERLLKHRNKLLDMAEGQVIHNIFENQLDVWDKQLTEAGMYVQQSRKMFFEFAKENLHKVSRELFGNEYLLQLDYKPVLITPSSLESCRSRDLFKGSTSVGPHRDDFDFIMVKNNRKLDLQGYGSRGQQRTAALALKILELQYIEKETNVIPTLLLDDIFSELDDNFRENITNVMKKYQTIVTSAEHIEEEFESVLRL